MRAHFGAAVVLVVLVVAGCTERPMIPVFADPSGTAVESFIQIENDAATILFVVDNSGSMCEEQFNLRNNVISFTDALQTTAAGARYHIGVVTTDTLDPAQMGRLNNVARSATMTGLCTSPPPPLDCATGLPSPLPKWVDDSMDSGDQERIFGCLSSVGISGFGGETALGAARMALSDELLSDPTANAGFLMEDSLLAIIFLGDEDDCSVCSGSVCGPLPNLQSNLECAIDRVNELTPVDDFLVAMGGVVENVLVASITGVDPTLYSTRCDSGVCEAPVSAGPVVADPGGEDALVPLCTAAGLGSAVPAPRIEDFTRRFPVDDDDSLQYSICDPNYGNELAEIGYRIGALLSSGCLEQTPCPLCDPDQCGVAAAWPSCNSGLDPLAERVIVRSVVGGVTTTLTPCVDYDIVPDAAGPSCAGGFRIDFDPALTGGSSVPAGAEVEVVYGFDAGDRCAGTD